MVKLKVSGYLTTFIKRDGKTMSIRFTDSALAEICRAGHDLNARYFVAIEEHYAGLGPLWGVFDMDKAQRDNPTPGQWSVNDPIKTFPIDAHDAAVMYATMILGRR